MSTVIRTSTGVLVPNTSPFWGTTLHPGTDPDAPAIPDKAIGAINLAPDLGESGASRIPARLWQKVVALYYHVLDWSHASQADSTCEVQVVFLRGDGTKRPRTEWRILVPSQSVGGAYVQTDYTKPLVDIDTGDTLASIDAAAGDGWLVAGTSHSHGKIAAFFSATDDRSELSQPGLHIVLGNLRPGLYDFDVSVVMRGRRYTTVMDLSKPEGARPMVIQDVVDSTPGSATVHPNVMTVVTRGHVARNVVVVRGQSDFDWGSSYLSGTTGFQVWVIRWVGSTPRLCRVPFNDLAQGAHFWPSATKAMAGYPASVRGNVHKRGAPVPRSMLAQVVSDDCDMVAVRRGAETLRDTGFYDAEMPGKDDTDPVEPAKAGEICSDATDPDDEDDTSLLAFVKADPDPEQIMAGIPALADFVTDLIDHDFKRSDVTTIVRLLVERVPNAEALVDDDGFDTVSD